MNQSTMRKQQIEKHFPPKSKCLRELRKVFPSARFEREEDTMSLLYLCPQPRTWLHVVTIAAPAGTPERVLAYKTVIEAFRSLGYQTRWNEQTHHFDKHPILGFKGPEHGLPIELDPATSDPEFNKMAERFLANRAKDSAPGIFAVMALRLASLWRFLNRPLFPKTAAAESAEKEQK